MCALAESFERRRQQENSSRENQRQIEKTILDKTTRQEQYMSRTIEMRRKIAHPTQKASERFFMVGLQNTT